MTKTESGVTHLMVPRFKQRFSFIIPSFDSLYEIMDVTKVNSYSLFIVLIHSSRYWTFLRYILFHYSYSLYEILDVTKVYSYSLFIILIHSSRYWTLLRYIHIHYS